MVKAAGKPDAPAGGSRYSRSDIDALALGVMKLSTGDGAIQKEPPAKPAAHHHSRTQPNPTPSRISLTTSAAQQHNRDTRPHHNTNARSNNGHSAARPTAYSSARTSSRRHCYCFCCQAAGYNGPPHSLSYLDISSYYYRPSSSSYGLTKQQAMYYADQEAKASRRREAKKRNRRNKAARKRAAREQQPQEAMGPRQLPFRAASHAAANTIRDLTASSLLSDLNLTIKKRQLEPSMPPATPLAAASTASLGRAALNPPPAAATTAAAAAAPVRSAHLEHQLALLTAGLEGLQTEERPLKKQATLKRADELPLSDTLQPLLPKGDLPSVLNNSAANHSSFLAAASSVSPPNTPPAAAPETPAASAGTAMAGSADSHGLELQPEVTPAAHPEPAAAVPTGCPAAAGATGAAAAGATGEGEDVSRHGMISSGAAVLAPAGTPAGSAAAAEAAVTPLAAVGAAPAGSAVGCGQEAEAAAVIGETAAGAAAACGEEQGRAQEEVEVEGDKEAEEEPCSGQCDAALLAAAAALTLGLQKLTTNDDTEAEA